MERIFAEELRGMQSKFYVHNVSGAKERVYTAEDVVKFLPNVLKAVTESRERSRWK